MNNLLYLIFGLLIGAGVGLTIASLRAKAGSAKIEAELAAAQGSISSLNERLTKEQSDQIRSAQLNTELLAMKDSVQKLTTQSHEANRIRTEAETKLEGSINEMRRASESIFDETKKIAGALANTQTRGKFGEAQLELILENAGLRENHEYTRQKSTTDSDSTGIPDITIHMPGGSILFLDSKFPFDRFLDAFATDDLAKREGFLKEHTKDLFKHVEALAKRGYQKSDKSPDFVVLFVPFETLLSEPLRLEPLFLEKAFKLGVTIATPTSMMALLRTVGYIFTRNKLADNADEIQKVANTFLKGITLLHSKIIALGKAINSTTKAFDELVPTAERTVLSPARKILSLGVSGDKDKLAITYPESAGDVRGLRNQGSPDSLETPAGEDDFIDVDVVESNSDEQ